MAAMTKQHGALTPSDIKPADAEGRGNHVIQGLESVADETARNAIVQTSLDRGRVVEQTAGNSPGFYIARGTTGSFYRVTETAVQEMHLVTSGEVTAGYFTLTGNPTDVDNVCVTKVVGSGARQINKQVVGATGATPDFDVLSTNQIHINSNGGASGLSDTIVATDVVIIDYHV